MPSCYPIRRDSRPGFRDKAARLAQIMTAMIVLLWWRAAMDLLKSFRLGRRGTPSVRCSGEVAISPPPTTWHLSQFGGPPAAPRGEFPVQRREHVSATSADAKFFSTTRRQAIVQIITARPYEGQPESEGACLRGVSADAGSLPTEQQMAVLPTIPVVAVGTVRFC